MIFPESDRVIYQNNPLEQVICQLRFPTILKIETEKPANFQDKIRHVYPILNEKTEIPIMLPPEVAQQLPQDVIQSLRPSRRAYDFKSSDDDDWIVSLTDSFLALTSNDYKRWEEFLDHLLIPFNVLKEEYSPAFFSRVGLRYQNVIRKSSLGLEDLTWSELLNKYIVGELASPDLTDAIEEIAHIILVKLGNQGHVRIRHGFAKDNNTGELVGYIIDSDFYIEEKMEVDNAIDLLVEFNRQNRQLFRWCISDQLHAAMEPQRAE